MPLLPWLSSLSRPRSSPPCAGARADTHEAPSAVAHRASGRGWLRHPPRPPHRPKPQCRRQDGLRSPVLPACQQPAHDGHRCRRRRRNCCQGRTSGGAGIGGRRAQVAGSDGGHRGARAVLCCRAGGLAAVGGALEGVLPKTTVRNSAGPSSGVPSSVLLRRSPSPTFPTPLERMRRAATCTRSAARPSICTVLCTLPRGKP